MLSGTEISKAHNKGTWCMPNSRAASAGNVDCKSAVVVKIADTTSSKSSN